ncbi:laminin G, partial [Streptomyces sp. TRM76130]|nr:laminin G [Streptomyces sp. TRM76130]
MPFRLRARTGRPLTVLASLLALSLAPPPTAHALAPAFAQQVLFRADQETGYACFRIPALVRTT